jgi:phosphohistidine phosphatase
MLLILLRHAEAVDRAADDASRQLTAKGIDQAARVAKYLRRKQLLPDLVVCSPVTRAKQTAVLVAEAVDRPLELDADLRPGMAPDAGLGVLARHETDGILLVVGHEPDLSGLASVLLGSDRAGMLHLRKASITGIELARAARGCGELQFLVPVRLM